MPEKGVPDACGAVSNLLAVPELSGNAMRASQDATGATERLSAGATGVALISQTSFGEKPISNSEDRASEGQTDSLALKGNEHTLQESLVFNEEGLW